MNTMNNRTIPKFNSLEEEKTYWESHGICSEENEGEVNEPVPLSKRSAFLSIRLTGKELTQLRDVAAKMGLGPSTFARKLLLDYIALQNEPSTDVFNKPCHNLDRRYSSLLTQYLDSIRNASLHDMKPFLLVDRDIQDKTQDFMQILLALLSHSTLCKLITPDDSNYEKIKKYVDFDLQKTSTDSR